MVGAPISTISGIFHGVKDEVQEKLECSYTSTTKYAPPHGTGKVAYATPNSAISTVPPNIALPSPSPSPSPSLLPLPAPAAPYAVPYSTHFLASLYPTTEAIPYSVAAASTSNINITMAAPVPYSAVMGYAAPSPSVPYPPPPSYSAVPSPYPTCPPNFSTSLFYPPHNTSSTQSSANFLEPYPLTGCPSLPYPPPPQTTPSPDLYQPIPSQTYPPPCQTALSQPYPCSPNLHQAIPSQTYPPPLQASSTCYPPPGICVPILS
ncbi:Proline-rich receptor-like protein kinase [Actinidia chinensis var. chinensis]|uniref:Proline-rich receptor-like protein kinase n=1 Tax=Actinidia chinensis var. chinensis TaxID=1590841 RepID=A0A2R6QHG0_ACTCC|nr:Proline-rich receptor-like protein kinase [Actinidia chinensis var. chinensis]